MNVLPAMPPEAALMQLVTGSILSQAVYAAAQLEIADHLDGIPKTVDQLAASVGAHPGALQRLLRTLVSAGVFSQTDEGSFALAPTGTCLKSGGPNSMRHMVLMMGSKWRLRAWEEIVYSIKTGKSAFDSVHGVSPFEYFRAHPDAAAVFHDAMVSYTATIAPAVIAAYDFSQCGTVVDVAGGHGYLLGSVLRANPGISGVLFDLPEVVAGASEILGELGVSKHCKVVGGDFFDSIVGGGDVYIMKQIIHDWEDDAAIKILCNCRTAIRAGGRLLLLETVVPTGNDPCHAKLLDLEVLVALGGKERTEAEYSQLLSSAGFQLRRIIDTRAGIQIVEGEAN